MQSRMDKYQVGEKKRFERTRKNTKLYEDVYDDIYRDTTYKNTEVLDSAREINLNKLKDLLDDKYDTRQYRTLKNYDIIDDYEKPNPYKTENKSYDINEIINEAKQRRSFLEEAKEKRKYIDFTERNKRYDRSVENLEKEEKELEELINTMAIKKETVSDELDILSELKGDDNTVVTKPVTSQLDSESFVDTTKTDEITKDIEKTLVKADKTFYTDSNMFTKNDFEDFSTLSRSLGKKRGAKKLIIIIIILVLLAALLYFGITKFGMEKYLNKIIDIFKKK